MASLSTSSHQDSRSASLPTKRARDHNTKWSHGARPSPGVMPLYHLSDPLSDPFSVPFSGSPAQQSKFRPVPDYRTHKHRHNFNSPGPSSWDEGAATNRIARKHDALREIRSVPLVFPSSPGSASASPSRSLVLELAAMGAGVNAGEAEVLYSFDKETTPGAALGLDGLVEKAEQEWHSRETDRMLRNEYEMLDERGEEVKLAGPKGKGRPGRKGGSPRAAAAAAVPVASTSTAIAKGLEEEDDWETI